MRPPQARPGSTSRARLIIAVLISSAMACGPAAPRQPSAAPPPLAIVAPGPAPALGLHPALWDEDRASIEALHREGRRIDGAEASVWFPADADADAAMRVLVRALDVGVKAAREMLAASRAAPARPHRLWVYVHAAIPIAHAPSGPFVFLPLELARAGQAPWLHEALHALLPSDGSWLATVDEATATAEMPLWLTEGLADYLAHRLSESLGVAFNSPFGDDVLAQTDAVCAARLASPEGTTLVPFIGGHGRPAQLFGPERFAYASVFYPCAKSFVAFLVATYGLAPLIDANARFRHELTTLEATIGTSLASARATWCATRAGLACGGPRATTAAGSPP